MKRLFLILATCLFAGVGMAEEFRPLTVEVQTPHPGFGLRIERVDLHEGVLHVLARVIPPDPDMMYPMVISSASDTIQVQAPAAETRVQLLGRTWNWGDDPAVASEEEYLRALQGAVAVEFRRVDPGAELP